MKWLLRPLLLTLPIAAAAQSSLPPCPSNAQVNWHQCFGTFSASNGDVYIGEWRDNKPHGWGTSTFRDGQRHVGEYRDGKRNGQGRWTYADGEKYVGEWRDDKEHGPGIEYRADGTVGRSGVWSEGNLIQPRALDRNRFPFDGPLQAAAASPDPGRAERDRLAAEAEAARRRQRELEAQLEAERKRRVDAESRGRAQASSTGTGFAVAPGMLVTNQHVVAGCRSLEVVSTDGRRAARVVGSDELVDLALLRVTGLGGNVAPIRRVGSVRLGEQAYAFGFPLTGLLSESGNFTGGTVSSLRGMRDSASQIQISTPVQPGNSGGALADASGSVIGVVVGKLNASAIARATGDIPQNVNFAVSLQALSDFLRRNNVAVQTVDRGASLDTAQLADVLRSFTHRIECLDPAEPAARTPPQAAASGPEANDTTVELRNQSREIIFKIFVAPQNASSWGPDLLGASALSSGDSFTLKPPASQGCIFKVRVEYARGQFEQKERQDFCALMDLVFSGESRQTAAGSGPNWELVTQSTTGTKTFVAPNSIRRDGHLRRFWKLFDYAPSQTDGIQSQRIFEEIDCREERGRRIEVTGFSGSMLTGSITGTWRDGEAWVRIAPGTVGANTMRYVCAR